MSVFQNNSSQVFQVDLVNDTATWWYDREVFEGGRTPLQKFKSFVVPLKLDLLVDFVGVRHSGNIGLYGVVDDKIDWAQRVDLLWIASKSDHRVSHGG